MQGLLVYQQQLTGQFIRDSTGSWITWSKGANDLRQVIYTAAVGPLPLYTVELGVALQGDSAHYQLLPSGAFNIQIDPRMISLLVGYLLSPPSSILLSSLLV